MNVRRRRVAVSLLIAGSLALLAGCTPDPTLPSPPPSESSSPTATPTPTASPTGKPTDEPTAAGAERIVVGAEEIVVLSADGGALATFDYFQPTAEVVAGLTQYLGAPVDTWFEGHGHALPATFHDWGGLRLADTVPPGARPYDPEHWVRITSSDANGLIVGTVDGVVVGDHFAELEAAQPSDEVYRWTSPETNEASVSFRIDIVELPELPGTENVDDDWSPSFGVVVIGNESTGVITSLAAPSANFGA